MALTSPKCANLGVALGYLDVLACADYGFGGPLVNAFLDHGKEVVFWHSCLSTEEEVCIVDKHSCSKLYGGKGHGGEVFGPVVTFLVAVYHEH